MQRYTKSLLVAAGTREFASVVGLVLTLLTGNLTWVLVQTGAVFLIVQSIEDFLLVPRMMGKAMGLSPAMMDRLMLNDDRTHRDEVFAWYRRGCVMVAKTERPVFVQLELRAQDEHPLIAITEG